MTNKLDWQKLMRPAPKWYRDAKFGLFFHWGPYSVPAFQNEWYSRNMYAKGLQQNLHHVKTYGELKDFGYKDFYNMLTGEGFDAEQWADLAARSGAVYAGPVTEHSDNFSMWDSAVSDINSVNFGPKKDITGLCESALRKRGVRFLSTFHHAWNWGWFMSTDNEADVYNPQNERFYGKALPLETNRYIPYRMPDAEFNELWMNKVLEVCEKYRPDVLFFDSRTCIIDEEIRYKTAERYYELCPEGIITYKQSDYPHGVGVQDVEKGRFADIQPEIWQTDDRLEDNVTWCIVQEPKYKKAGVIVHHLCDTTAKNGTLLLNIGPCTDGSFHPAAVREIHAVGDWLKECGEAIYGTRPYTTASEGPTGAVNASYTTDLIEKQTSDGIDIETSGVSFSGKDFRFTAKDDAVYAITFGWPEDGKLVSKVLAKSASLPSVKEVRLLGHSAPLEFTHGEQGLQAVLPEKKPCDHAYVLKVVTK